MSEKEASERKTTYKMANLSQDSILIGSTLTLAGIGQKSRAFAEKEDTCARTQHGITSKRKKVLNKYTRVELSESLLVLIGGKN